MVILEFCPSLMPGGEAEALATLRFLLSLGAGACMPCNEVTRLLRVFSLHITYVAPPRGGESTRCVARDPLRTHNATRHNASRLPSCPRPACAPRTHERPLRVPAVCLPGACACATVQLTSPYIVTRPVAVSEYAARFRRTGPHTGKGYDNLVCNTSAGFVST